MEIVLWGRTYHHHQTVQQRRWNLARVLLAVELMRMNPNQTDPPLPTLVVEVLGEPGLGRMDLWQVARQL
jgi:hypothetical protein